MCQAKLLGIYVVKHLDRAHCLTVYKNVLKLFYYLVT